MSTIPAYPRLIKSNGIPNHEFVEVLHYYYQEEIASRKMSLLGRKINFTVEEIQNGKNKLFWHLLTGNYDAQVEDIRFKRSKRILFIPFMIEHFETNPSHIHWFPQTKNGRQNLVILNFDKKEPYQCVLEEKGNTYQLITAYPLNRRYHDKRIKEYENFYAIQNKNRPLK